MSALEWLSLTAGPLIGGALGWIVGWRYARARRRDAEELARLGVRGVDSGRTYSPIKVECGHHFTRLADGEVVKCCLEAGHECAHAWWTR